MTILELHKKLIDKPDYLCYAIPDENIDEFEELMAPDKSDAEQHRSEGLNSFVWGADHDELGTTIVKYNPFRQNIVLLFAAYMGEL